MQNKYLEINREDLMLIARKHKKAKLAKWWCHHQYEMMGSLCFFQSNGPLLMSCKSEEGKVFMWFVCRRFFFIYCKETSIRFSINFSLLFFGNQWLVFKMFLSWVLNVADIGDLKEKAKFLENYFEMVYFSEQLFLIFKYRKGNKPWSWESFLGKP